MRMLYAENTANYPRLKTDVCWVDYENEINYNGIFQKTVEFIEQFQLLRKDWWNRFVKQFKLEDADFDGGWRGEYWGKMMRGASLVYSYSRNEELYKVLEGTVRDMLTAQEKSGRISTYSKNHEFSHWDMWCRKYVLLGMQYFLEICQDDELAENIIVCMCGQVDYMMQYIGEESEGKLPITQASNYWRGMNASSILEPIVRLYSLTQEKKYLEFATHIVDAGGFSVANLFEYAYEDKLYPYQYPITKAYEMTSCFEGLLEYYRVTGIEKYKETVIRFADKVLESDFTIIGGGGCTHELFDHSTVRQANTTNGEIAQETCVTVTLMKFFHQLTLLTGDPKYVDAIETAFYNAYLGAINTDKVVEPTICRTHPDWAFEPLPFDSYSPLTAGTRGRRIGGLKHMEDNHYYGCCACIGSAGLGVVSKTAVLTEERGLIINLYFDGSVKTKTQSGNPVTIVTETDYPVSRKIRIQVVPENKEYFELKLRIPAWSKKNFLRVNEEIVDVIPGHVKIEREWTAGDVVELILDMRTEAIYPISYGHQVLMNGGHWKNNYMVPTYDEEDPIAKNHIALRRGPVILAQENRLGYCVDDPIRIAVGEDGYVDAVIAADSVAPYEKLLEVEVPLADGTRMHVTDYGSAGKQWTEATKMAAWMLTEAYR